MNKICWKEDCMLDREGINDCMKGRSENWKRGKTKHRNKDFILKDLPGGSHGSNDNLSFKRISF